MSRPAIKLDPAIIAELRAYVLSFNVGVAISKRNLSQRYHYRYTNLVLKELHDEGLLSKGKRCMIRGSVIETRQLLVEKIMSQPPGVCIKGAELCRNFQLHTRFVNRLLHDLSVGPDALLYRKTAKSGFYRARLASDPPPPPPKPRGRPRKPREPKPLAPPKPPKPVKLPKVPKPPAPRAPRRSKVVPFEVEDKEKREKLDGILRTKAQTTWDSFKKAHPSTLVSYREKGGSLFSKPPKESVSDDQRIMRKIEGRLEAHRKAMVKAGWTAERIKERIDELWIKYQRKIDAQDVPTRFQPTSVRRVEVVDAPAELTDDDAHLLILQLLAHFNVISDGQLEKIFRLQLNTPSKTHQEELRRGTQADQEHDGDHDHPPGR